MGSSVESKELIKSTLPKVQGKKLENDEEVEFRLYLCIKVGG